MKYNLCDINEINRLLRKHNFNFKKSLGQNFIVDNSVCPEIVRRSSIDKNTGVLEIGPGIGVLTCEIAKKAKKVLSVEVDASLIPVLHDTLSDYGNVSVVNTDVMKTDLEKLVKNELMGCENLIVCSNLPYNITSPVIMKLLEENPGFTAMTFMVQKEAGVRLCADVGSRDAGAVTCAVDYYSDANELFDVSRSCFYPQPKVDSEVIELKIREKPQYEIENTDFFFKLIRAAFTQRRKTAVNGINSAAGIEKSKITEAMESLNIPVNIRAEKFTMSDWVNFSNRLFELTGAKNE